MLAPHLSIAFRSATGSSRAKNVARQTFERFPAGLPRSAATVTPLPIPKPKEKSGFRILGVHIDNLSMSEAIGTIVKAARSQSAASFAFVNADCLNIASKDHGYAAVLAGQTRVFADGSGIALAAKLRGIKVRENVNGTDMFPLLCAAAADQGLSIFLLGGRSDVAGRAAANMASEYPDLSIAGTHHGFFNKGDDEAIISMINESGADILLVGLGAPRQEKWIAAHRAKLAPRVTLAVGGLFDYYSGRVWRAPVVMRSVGTEWVWRMMQEPKRLWRRYILGNPRFLAFCVLEQISLTLKLSEAPDTVRSLDRYSVRPSHVLDLTGSAASANSMNGQS